MFINDDFTLVYWLTILFAFSSLLSRPWAPPLVKNILPPVDCANDLVDYNEIAETADLADGRAA